MNVASPVTAADIIYRFSSRAYFDGMVVVHESDWLFKPDIATITRDLKVNEYEIKVSIQDLRKELDYIDFATADHNADIAPQFDWGVYDQTIDETWEERESRKEKWLASGHKKYHRSDNKYIKHRYYLYDTKTHYVNKYKPNRFYFILPKELYEKEKARLDALPYGVIDARYFFSLKRCKPLHNVSEVDARTMWHVALNLCHKIEYKEPDAKAS